MYSDLKNGHTRVDKIQQVLLVQVMWLIGLALAAGFSEGATAQKFGHKTMQYLLNMWLETQKLQYINQIKWKRKK